MIYLDYAANTPTDERVLKEFCEVNQEFFGNPNSQHCLGEQANRKMQQVTEDIRSLLNLSKKEIIYTSGASESNNTAIKGIARSSRHIGKHIITSMLEHSSVSGTLTFLQQQGYEIDMVSIKQDGTIDLEELRELMRKDTVLVTVNAVESELGVIQPIQKIAEIVREFEHCKLHLDATQAVGKIPVDFSLADTISFAPHKFFGLNGSGILVKGEEFAIEPLIHGGVSTTLYRSGTPTLALAAAACKALSLAVEEYETRDIHVRSVSSYLKEELLKRPYCIINSVNDSVPHIVNVSIEKLKSYEIQQRLSDREVCISAKSACSVMKTPSKPVMAVTKDKKRARSSFRISICHKTTREEIQQFLQTLDEIVAKV